MRSEASSRFWNCYATLPRHVQKIAIKQYLLWIDEPWHPSLHFKKVEVFWSARITDDYRALGVRRGDLIVWFWIGSHAKYEREIRG